MDARYAIERRIASGGMATVYLGRDSKAGAGARPVAIKICHPHLLDGPADLREHRTQALLDEARVASRIHHPNVVSVLDVVVQDDALMIVMEYVEGVTVAGLIRGATREDARVPVDVALRVACDALAGLHAAHELRDEEGELLGVVHRDVSPQNILVGIDGHAKLADFGVFKGGDRLAPSTETGDLKGKLGYVAPEVYRGERVSRRADVYAVGIVVWEMLAGKRLFDESTHAALMHRVLSGRIPPLSTIRNDVPIELDAILSRALAQDPQDRFDSAESLATSLESLSLLIAPARVVARHVESTMSSDAARASLSSSSSSSSSSALLSSSALASALASSSDAPHALDSLTPSEYVTPVRTSRPPRAATSRALALLGAAALAILVLLGAALYAAPSLTPTGASSHAPHAAIIVEATPAPFVVTNVRNTRFSAPAPAPAAPSLPRPRVRNAASPSPASVQPIAPGTPAAQPFFDPKEL